MLAANVFETFGVGRNETIGANLFAPIIFITSRLTFEELTYLSLSAICRRLCSLQIKQNIAPI